jgi:hypothetical protein
LHKASRFPFGSLPFSSFPIAVFDHPHRLTYDHVKSSRTSHHMNTVPTFGTGLRVTHSARLSASPGNDRYEHVPLGSYFWCCLVLFGAVWCSLVLKFIFAKIMAEADRRSSSLAVEKLLKNCLFWRRGVLQQQNL